MSKSIAKRSTRTKRTAVPDEIVRAVEAAADKKANDIVVLDLREAAGFTDFFMICTGGNARQIRAIADAIETALGRQGTKPAHVEGYRNSEWILLDYFDFVVHVFSEQMRAFYGLERLWGSASHLDLSGVLPEASRT
jgi:ribosome-associated protein